MKRLIKSESVDLIQRATDHTTHKVRSTQLDP